MSGGNLDLFAGGAARGRASGGLRSRPPRPSPPAPRVWTVAQVNRAARLLLEESMPRLWLRGEVANFNRHRSGHCYFSLKDRSSQIRCVMFQREAARLPVRPADGMTLRVFGRLTLYEARGQYQFVADRVEADGEGGMWKLAFDRLRARLDAEGLTDPARKRPLPPFPSAVGVVTSPAGAALRDIVAVTARRAPWVRMLVRGAGVQGRESAPGIAAAIGAVAARGVDVVIVARGGGSIEDLWGFNEEPVARAVAACPVPVVSGVGHETDVTICDLVADVRAATPSAAAEAAAPDGEALGRRLGEMGRRLGRGLAGHARSRRWRAERAREDLVGAVRRVAERRRQRLDRGRRAMIRTVRGRAVREGARIAEAAAALDALSPLSTLRRGYAVPLGEGGDLLRRISDFAPERRFGLRVVDGSVPCTVAGPPVAGPSYKAAPDPRPSAPAARR